MYLTQKNAVNMYSRRRSEDNMRILSRTWVSITARRNLKKKLVVACYAFCYNKHQVKLMHSCNHREHWR